MPATPSTMVESQLARRCAAVSMLEGATGQTAFTSTSALSQAAEQLTLPTLVPAPLRWPHELQQARTPLRGSAFELELSHHPDKAWVSRLLIGINNGVSTGYKGPHYHFQARNLASALAHPEVVDAELKKEVDSGRVLGPFPRCPLHNFRTSGLGVVLKKNGKWRMILHLSAPEGHSINDYISKDEFSLHYSTIDDAVALLGKFQRGALMAKLDLQAAFRMVPIRPSEWELLGMHWRGQYYVDTCLPFGLRSAPSIFNVPSIGSWSITMELPSCTTWMTSSFLAHLDCPPVRTPCPPCCVSARSWACQSPGKSLKGQPLA